MSRIGRRPIDVPGNVEIVIGEENLVRVKGPKGELNQQFDRDILFQRENGTLTVERPDDQREHRSLHGLTRTLLANMVTGVTDGFTRNLEIAGVGYRVAKDGQALVFSLGFSHPVRIDPPTGVSFNVETPTRFSVNGIDKQVVGEQAAQIRKLREPEPYKGKGIMYAGERIRRKAGKAGKVGAKK